MNHRLTLEVDSIAKKFCRTLRKSLWYGIQDVGREVVGRPTQTVNLRQDEFWALRDVSFSLSCCEALGLLGRNGAGKTTLLKMLVGLIKPDAGQIIVRGRVAPLIELGAGFAPVLTGRENIYVNGTILGLQKRMIDRRIDDIVAFAEIDNFIDMPVQSYSQGMKARLGFAVAAHLNPEVLFVDEVLAVGDLAFQRKCLTHMKNYLQSGGALILVSHNMHLIQSVCHRCLVLDRGAVVFDGPTAVAVEKYSCLNEATDGPSPTRAQVVLTEANPVVVDSVEIKPLDASQLRPGGSLRMNLRYRALRNVAGVTWGFSFWTGDNETRIATCLAKYAGKEYALQEGSGELSCVVRNIPLVPRLYCLRSGIYDAGSGWPIARLGWNGEMIRFEVKGSASEANGRHLIDGDIVELDVQWAE